jgi:hypothetical protein
MILVTLAIAATPAAADTPCFAPAERPTGFMAGTDVGICVTPGEGGPTKCWRVDVATGMFIPHPANGFEPIQSRDAPLISPPIPSGFSASARTVANGDGSLAAVWEGTRMRVYDRGKLAYAVQPWKTDIARNEFQHARFIGDELVVWLSASPVSSNAHLFAARTGAYRATLGEGDSLAEGVAIRIDDTHWLFGGFAAPRLYVHDLATGKLEKTIVVGGPVELLGRLGDGRVVALARHDFVLLDISAGTQQLLSLSACRS